MSRPSATSSKVAAIFARSPGVRKLVHITSVPTITRVVTVATADAITFDFDAEEAIVADDPANADRPGVLSQGTYGAKVAVPLILDLLRSKGVTATFFIPGRVAERHPSRVEAIVAAGHEIAHHG